MKKFLFIIGIVAVAGFLMGLPYLLRQGSDNKGLETAPEKITEVTNKEVNVLIENFAFSPKSITVKKGTTVTWTNNDDIAHTVTGDGKGPDSDFLNKGQVYSYTFNEIGMFSYRCKPHPSMTATVIVIE